MNKAEDNLIMSGIVEGNDIFQELISTYPRLATDDYRQGSIIFAIFINCVRYLYHDGYTERELINEVFDHCEMARDELND